MDKARLISILESRSGGTTLDDVPALLPEEFLINFVLKHGVLRAGERGHLVETKVSQSSDPQGPRAIIFDERSGFSVSYNAGFENQTAGQRLDLLSFDQKTKKFRLEQIEFPLQPGHVQATTTDCARCHGPHHRPIFSMYPDWPSFYGSDNDELTGKTPVQVAEFTDYKKFRLGNGKNHPRYSPLFSNERVRRYLGMEIYQSYPYRPDNSEQVQNTSRAFAFRPELRFGILYNRLNAQNLVSQIKAHSRFKEFAPYFLFNLFQCSWGPEDSSTQTAWKAKAEQTLNHKLTFLSGGLLDYRQNWALFDLKLNDVDIRYSYDHPGYANKDASKKVMEVGYIGHYFNSYFDGSATIDELVAGHLAKELSLKGIQLWGLKDKYRHLEQRYVYDAAFFQQMDEFGKWIHIPYPTLLAKPHHRETFTKEFQRQHNNICGQLKEALR